MNELRLSNHPLQYAFLFTYDFIVGVHLCCRMPSRLVL